MFIGFNYDDRVVAWEHTVEYFPLWFGFSGLGGFVRNEPKVPFWREFLMYPLLFLASFVVVIFSPFKYLDTFFRLFFFKMNLWEYITELWNIGISILDAFYMAFLSPVDIIINFFILLPLDIVWYLVQVATWLTINWPVISFYLLYGFDILNDRLYWMALFLIYHFVEFKDLMKQEFDNDWKFLMVYLVLPFALPAFMFDYYTMAFGWGYTFEDVGYISYV
jgi:hypothetical protein